MANTFIFSGNGLLGVFAYLFWIVYLIDIEMQPNYNPQEPPFFFPAAFYILFIGVFAIAFSLVPGGQ